VHAIWWIVVALVVIGAVCLVVRRRPPTGLEETERIEELGPQRIAELLRGTSLHLRDLRYRYSIVPDRSGRASFSKDLNALRIGFVPVVIHENAGDRQGDGFVAFVYDGRRWCGPGLPCVGGPERAVAHAMRCISPLAGNESRGDGAAGPQS
jgi:hypothetical protein